MRIAFLRHGPTEWNAARRFQGHTDIPLSAEGLRKCGACAHRRLLSPPVRQSIAPGAANRRGFGPFQAGAGRAADGTELGPLGGPDAGAILARDGEDAFARAGLAAAFNPPGGESTKALMDRVAAFLKDVAEDDSDAIAIAHLGVLRAAYTLATAWDMATPIPAELDISKVLVLEQCAGALPHSRPEYGACYRALVCWQMNGRGYTYASSQLKKWRAWRHA